MNSIKEDLIPQIINQEVNTKQIYKYSFGQVTIDKQFKNSVLLHVEYFLNDEKYYFDHFDVTYKNIFEGRLDSIFNFIIKDIGER
jgi:hypothetical protein